MRLPRYPVIALGLLAAVDGFHGYALLVLAPDISATLGIGTGPIVSMALLALVTSCAVALPLAEAVARAGRRAATAVGAGAAWAAGLATTAVVTGPWGLAALVVADGASSGATRALHPALLADVYPARARVRALAAHRALAGSGAVVAPALVALLSAAGLTWRGVYLVFGAIAAVIALLALRVRDPRPADRRPAALRPTAVEQARAVLAVPTARRLLAGYAIAGLFLAPLIGHLLVFLEERWGLGPSGRGAFFSLIGLVTIVVLMLFAREAQRRLEVGPASLLAFAWPLNAFTALALAAAVAAPSFGAAVSAFSAAFACLAVGGTALMAVLLTVVPAETRTAAAALAGIAAAGVGGAGGVLLTAGMTDALGGAFGVAVLAAPAAICALVVRSAAATADDDAAEALARAARTVAARDRDSVAVLECRALRFGYDHRRVLDGVDLLVEPGEVVAVLGTNGAGKTTLLRVLSGLAVPQGGTVLLDGHDVTAAQPERRARVGLVHLPGGAATFPGLTVREHLRVLDEKQGIRLLDRLAPLRARADVRAERLSGGERQLLGLAPTMLRPPRVLLVDEPTRNLSPEAALHVLDLLGDLARAGSAVILVEQSIEAAARVANRAIFLERGRVRFAGKFDVLRERTDLVRPVFLSHIEARGQREQGVPSCQ